MAAARLPGSNLHTHLLRLSASALLPMLVLGVLAIIWTGSSNCEIALARLQALFHPPGQCGGPRHFQPAGPAPPAGHPATGGRPQGQPAPGGDARKNGSLHFLTTPSSAPDAAAPGALGQTMARLQANPKAGVWDIFHTSPRQPPQVMISSSQGHQSRPALLLPSNSLIDLLPAAVTGC